MLPTNERHTSTRQRADVLASIVKTVQRHHFNAGGIDFSRWTALVEQQRPELLTIPEPDFEDGVREFLKQLKSSHTAFYHEQPTRFPPQHTIGATLQKIEHFGKQRWMFLDLFPEGLACGAGITPGEVLLSVDGVPVEERSTAAFGIGKAHALEVCRQDGTGSRTLTISIPRVRSSTQRPPLIEPHSIAIDTPTTGIGRLRVRYFPGAFGLSFGRELDRAFSLLRANKCERLILDLRGNIGGSLGFAHLASYLCPGSLPIGHSLTPARLRRGYTLPDLPRIPMPQSRAGLLMRLTRFAFQDKSLMLLTQGLGPQPFHGRVVMLVNQWTNSAAEIVASFAAENGLATLVGAKTAGNVLGARGFSVGHGYWLRIPIFGWFTSQGRSIDGIGVAPHVECAMDPAALASGHDTQLEHAIKIARTL